MNVLFTGGKIFLDGKVVEQDVLIIDGKIAQISDAVAVPTDIKIEVVQAKGCVLSPTFIDLHVHLRTPGYEQKETMQSGTKAAAAGGFGTICSMPNLNPMPDSLENLQVQLDAIDKNAVIEVLPYGTITVGEKGDSLADIEGMRDFVCGFTDDGRGVQNEEMMLEAMKKVVAADRFVAAHCEVESLIEKGSVTVQKDSTFAKEHGYVGVSNESEWAEVERNIALVAKTNCRFHVCHASTAKTFALVRAAQSAGLPVSCEVTPHNLLLCCDDITEDNARFKMNPPLRTAEDRDAALAALLDGTIQAVATDHAPHTAEEKAKGFAGSMNGVVGLETAFASLYTGLVQQEKISLEELLARFTEGPAQVLRQKAPQIEVGASANLVLLDLEREKLVDPAEFVSQGKASPFEGMRFKGWPILTIYNGKVVYKA